MASNWIVRHGAMRFLGEFDPEGRPYARGDEVVVRTDRGLELGQVLCPAGPRAVELITDLAREYQTRIEMRQIGVRDEAKLLADYGDCGKPVCCNTHMTTMPPVSMRMAKLQKSTLDPSKISGRCGRLKCCLRFEQDVYEEFQKELPPPGARILTPKGQGRVLAQEILARKLLVEFEDGRRILVDHSEILTPMK